MSNRRKPKLLNRTSGQRQRDPLVWDRHPGNPKTIAAIEKAEQESKKPKLILQPKGT